MKNPYKSTIKEYYKCVENGNIYNQDYFYYNNIEIDEKKYIKIGYIRKTNVLGMTINLLGNKEDWDEFKPRLKKNSKMEKIGNEIKIIKK
jgi:hypothetical protein